MPRELPEWIGKTDDSKVPDNVRARIFLHDKGVCQCGCKTKIDCKPWDLDHTIALINGGENRESNLRVLLRAHHKAKTADDVKVKAKDARVRKKRLGIKKDRTITRWRKFNGDPVHATRQR